MSVCAWCGMAIRKGTRPSYLSVMTRGGKKLPLHKTCARQVEKKSARDKKSIKADMR